MILTTGRLENSLLEVDLGMTVTISSEFGSPSSNKGLFHWLTVLLFVERWTSVVVVVVLDIVGDRSGVLSV